MSINYSNQSENVTNDIIAKSVRILNAQMYGNIYWVVLCILSLLICGLQILTAVFWKPLRKPEQSIITALAIADFLKTSSFLALSIQRLFETMWGIGDARTQRRCIVWLFFIRFPLNTVILLIVALSIERLVGLAFPVWYRYHNRYFRFYLIGISVLGGLTIAAIMFVGSSDSALLASCAYPTSPTETFRTFAKYFEATLTGLCVTINIVTCILLFVRWRKARAMRTDMVTFKKSIQLNALKTLVAVVVVYLSTTATASLAILVYNLPGWDETTKLSWTPVTASFEMLRGVLDFPLYVILVQEYRKGFREVVLRRLNLGKWFKKDRVIGLKPADIS